MRGYGNQLINDTQINLATGAATYLIADNQGSVSAPVVRSRGII
jgi:hypothetical protein